MGSRWLARLAVAGAAVTALFVSSPAWANSDISINDGNVPTTAANFDNHECNFGGGPYADSDVWVFVLPSNGGDAGVFLSVTATFDTGSGTTQLSATPPNGGIVNDNGTSKAWIKAPAGWTLTDATASISGTARDPKNGFNLTHTCPATGGNTSPSATASASSPGGNGGSPSGSSTGTVPGTPGTSTSSGGSLPVTGTAVGAFVAVGLLLVAGGVTLIVMRRRRDVTFIS
ncbi:MAG TPA: LPXTG cell wall anchor domain-containing protein [Micromonosporaceae bacterium]